MRLLRRLLLVALLSAAPIVSVAEDGIQPISTWPKKWRPADEESEPIGSVSFIGSSLTVVYSVGKRVRSMSRGCEATDIRRLETLPWAVACSPDGSLLAVGQATSAVAIYDVATGRRLPDMPGVGAARYLAWSPEGDRLLAANYIGEACVAAVASRGVISQRMISPAIVGAGWTRGHPYVVEVPTARRLEIRDAQTREVLKELDGEVEKGCIALSADGSALALVAGELSVRTREWTWHRVLRGRVTQVSISTDGSTVCVADSTRRLAFYGREDDSTPRTDHPLRHVGAIRGIALSRGGDFALTVGQDRAVHFWDVKEASHIRRVSCPPAKRLGLAVAPDAVSVETDEGTVVVGLDTGAISTAVATPPSAPALSRDAIAIVESRRVVASSFTADGKRALFAAPELELWDVVKKERLWTYENAGEVVGTVGVSGDGTRGIALHKDRVLRLWSLTKPWAIASLDVGWLGVPSAIAFGPRDEWVLIGTTDGRLHRFSLPKGE